MANVECVTCNTYKSLKYVKYKQLKFFAYCTNCGSIEAIYNWQIVGINDNKLVNLDNYTVLTPLDAPVLVLKSGVLDGLQSYKIVTNISVKGMDEVGSSSFLIENNPSPQNGSCIVTPGIGMSFLTVFTLKCSDWKDEDNLNQPFIYEVIATIGTISTTIYRGINHMQVILLPPGDERNDSMVSLLVQVEDSLGSLTKAFSGFIQVRPPNVSDYIQFLSNDFIPKFENSILRQDINKASSAIIASVLLLENEKNDTKLAGVLNKLVFGAASLNASSMETLHQISFSLDLAIGAGDKVGLNTGVRRLATSSLVSLLNLADSFSVEGYSLSEESYMPILRIIASNTKADFEKVAVRKRRSTELTLNYNLLNQLYKIILHTTLPGENGKMLESNSISTNLRRNKGSRLNGDVHAGKCSVSSNFSQIANESDLSQILECSTFNPFIYEEGSVSMLTFSYKNASLIEVPVSNLTDQECIILNVPAELDTSFTNSTLNVLPNEVYVSTLPLFKNVAYFNEGAVNILINITEYSGKGLVYVYLSENVNLTAKNKSTRVLAFGADDDANKRILFLSGRNYSLSSTYYLGIEHDFANNITLNVFVYTSHCLYWNTLSLGWDSSGCIPTKESTHENIVCKCNHLTSFTGSFRLKPNPLNFSILEKLDISSNPVAFATCIVIVLLYMIGLFVAYRRDRYEQKREHIIPFIGSDDGFYQYEIRFKTGPYPFAGSSAKVGIQIFGTSCTTKVRVIKTNNSFQRNGLDIFRISVDKSIGKIHKIHVWHDNSGSSPSWYLERVVIRSLSNGEKFFFFCNRWLGIDFEDGSLEADFHVANAMEMQKFSTIFCDVLLRMFSDFHLWVSVFERPKFSRFSRVQRVTCLVTLTLSWMAVNAMWFQVAPEGKIDLYIGFQSYSLEELAIAFITVAMVFPINLFFVLLFKKSRQRNIPQKQLKVWHQQRRTLMDVVEIDAKSFFFSSKGLEEFDIDVVDSLVRRKKKVLNVHALVEQENNFSYLDSGRVKESQFNNNATILHESSEIGSDTENVLLLPHSFNSGDKGFYRGSFNKSDTFHSNHNKDSIDKYHHLFRTQSLYSIKKNLVVADLQESLIKLRFSESQLNNRTERIVKQQISSMFDDLNEENHDDIKSDHSSGIFYQEPVSSILIKKNEILAEKLNIAEIREYDPCTRWTLPHFFVYVGYVCCFTISLFSILITIIYGQYFGYELALKWLKMLIFGILGDFFLIFPFVLILLSALIAIIKPLDLDQIDHYDFVECGEFPESNNETSMVTPLTGYSLEIAKRLGVKNKKIRKVAKFFVSQTILMWTVMSICWLTLPSSSSYTTTNYFQNAWNSPTSMRSIHNMHDYWFWFEHSWVPFLYRQHNATWMIASHPLVQLNGYSNGGCLNKKYAILENITTCFVVSDQVLDLCNRKNNSNCTHVSHEFKINIVKTHLLTKVFKILKSLEWFDGPQSSVNLEVIFADTRSSEHVYISHFFSVASGGYNEITSNIIFYRTDFFEHSSDYFLVFCIVVLFIIMLVTLSKVVSQGYRKGWKALKSFWSFHTVLMILFINVAIILIITQIICIYQYRNKMNNGMVPSGSNSYTFAFLTNLVIYVLGFVGFLVIVRNVCLFQLSSGYLYCAMTLSFAFKELVYFSLLHVLVSLMFAGAAVLLFDCWQIAGFSKAFFYVLFMRWWKPGYKVITDSSYGFGNAWFLLWKFYWFIVVVYIFKAILNCSSQLKKAEVEKMKFGLLKHIWKKINGSFVNPRRVRFIGVEYAEDNHQNGLKDVSEEQITETLVMQKPLPPLPFKTFDLDSKFSLLLTGLDKMINEDRWEEDTVKSYEKKISERKKLYRLSYTFF